MFSKSTTLSRTVLLAQLTAMLDDLCGLDLATVPDDDLLGLLRDLETQKNRLASLDHRLIAETASRRLAHEHACRDTATLLNHLLRISPYEAHARVDAAADMGPRRGLTGEVLAPIFGRVAAAQGDGTISVAHARVITATIDSLAEAIQAEHEESVQDVLVDQARVLDPRQLGQVAHRLRDTLDPDGTLANERDRARRRDLRVRRRPDGSSRIEGELTAICTEALLGALEALATPVPAERGARDPRTSGQRLHDAMQDAMLMVLRCGQLPDCGGFAATILFTMTRSSSRPVWGRSAPDTEPTSPPNWR
ncbi:MAG: hypothetical protein DLM57_16920 [Pseudonocardiales bacterium]|nr:MAG: hypothetical protein DLM57_16920 [Pseudonocardiales bacterium]